MPSLVAENCLKLLSRPLIDTPLLQPGVLASTSLLQDLEHAQSPQSLVSEKEILNILVKYFHAYIHEGSEHNVLDLKDITLCFDQFVHRRKGSVSLWGRKDLRLKLLKMSFALAMLADLPKTAHLFYHLSNEQLNPDELGPDFLGLDIGSGTGILILAQWIAAKKNGFKDIRIYGLERNEHVCTTSDALISRLGVGNMFSGDAKQESCYHFLGNSPVTYISNETIPGAGVRLWKEDFLAINSALFASLGPCLEKTRFFPSQIIARDKSGRKVYLSAKNRFQGNNERFLHLMYPYAIVMGNQTHELTAIGQDYTSYFPSEWVQKLHYRW